MARMKLSKVAEALGVEVEGDPDIDVTGVAGLEEASAGDLTFLSNPKYAALLKTTRASAVTLGNDAPTIQTAVLRSNNPYLSFARAVDLFYKPPVPPPGIHPSALIHPTAKIGARAKIGPYVVI